MPICISCHTDKLPGAFYSNGRKTCRECNAARAKRWKDANPARARITDHQSSVRRRSDPSKRRTELDQANARRRAASMRGDTKTAACSRCGDQFTYTFVQKHRTVCDLCRTHDADWKSFRLTGAQAEALRLSGSCDICGGTRPGGRFAEWHIDHDHSTGAVRGVLCAPCNTSLGQFKDSATLLRRAADYLDSGGFRTDLKLPVSMGGSHDAASNCSVPEMKEASNG